MTQKEFFTAAFLAALPQAADFKTKSDNETIKRAVFVAAEIANYAAVIWSHVDEHLEHLNQGQVSEK